MSKSLKLKDSTLEGVSHIEFHPANSDCLVASCWDKSLRLYDFVDCSRDGRPSLTPNKMSFQSSLLDCSFINNSTSNPKIASGGLDKFVYITDVQKASSSKIGEHGAPVRVIKTDVQYNSNGLVYSGSWDSSVRVWDPRSQVPLVKTLSLKNKVFSMDVSENFIICATSARDIYLFEKRHLKKPFEIRNTKLKQQIRCLTVDPDENYYACGSIEGRVSIQYINKENKTRKGYAFKCHRITDKEVNKVTVYPVNAICFHPIYKTFATAGCDGSVFIWDGSSRKKVSRIIKCQKGISSIAFSADGKKMAVAFSYTWEMGERPIEDEFIEVFKVKKKDVARKP